MMIVFGTIFEGEHYFLQTLFDPGARCL